MATNGEDRERQEISLKYILVAIEKIKYPDLLEKIEIASRDRSKRMKTDQKAIGANVGTKDVYTPVVDHPTNQ